MVNLRQNPITKILVPPIATLKKTHGDCSALKPIHTQHTPHIQPKDSKTFENHKEPIMKRGPNHNQITKTLKIQNSIKKKKKKLQRMLGRH